VTVSSNVKWPRRASGVLVAAALIGGALTSAPVSAYSVATEAEPFAKVYEKVLYGDFITVGNGNLKCPTTPSPLLSPQPSCEGGADRLNDAVNDAYDMQYVDVDSDGSTSNSSSARLTVPAGATVDYARLHWAGNTGEVTLPNGDPYTPACSYNAFSLNDPAVLPAGEPGTRSLRVTVGSGATESVPPQTFVGEPAPEPAQARYYSASADISTMFTTVPSGTPVDVTVGDIWTPQGLNCFGGWSLTVVFEFPGPDPVYAPAPRAVHIFDGHVRQDATASTTTVPINGFSYAGGPVRVGNTAYEGDWGIGGDQFLVNGTPVAEPSTGDYGNYFLSGTEGALNPNVLNNFSVDAKTAVLPDGLIPVGATSLDFGLVTTGDSYLEQQLALSIPLPELVVEKEVCRVSDAVACGPGGQGEWTDAALFPVGSTAYWRVTVRNPSTVDIADIVLDDPAAPACETAAGTFTLTAGQSVVFHCSSANLTDAVTNTATARFVPPGSPSGTRPLRSAPASAKADVYGVSLVKEVCQSSIPVDCGLNGVGPWSSTATIPMGGTAYWRIRIVDIGSVPVQGIQFDDPGESSCVIQSRDVAATFTYYCTSVDITSTRTNTATASFARPGAPPEAPRETTPPSSATVFIADLSLVKQVCAISDEVACAADGPGPWLKNAAVASGATAYWRMTVANLGEVPITGIMVDDVSEASCTAGPFDLAVATTRVIGCSTTNVTASKTNTATARYPRPGAPQGSPEITTEPDSATANIHRLEVVKSACQSLDELDCEGDGPWASAAAIPSGGTAFWRIVITNTGEVDLDEINLADGLEQSCVDNAGPPFSLAPAGTKTVYCSTTGVVERTANTAFAAYTPPNGAPTTSSPSEAVVDVSDVVVVKEVCLFSNSEDCDADGPDTWAKEADVDLGGTVHWRISVTNAGGAHVSGVVVHDSVEPDCETQAGVFDLEAGSKKWVRCSTDGVADDFVNTATASYHLTGVQGEAAAFVTPPDSARALPRPVDPLSGDPGPEGSPLALTGASVLTLGVLGLGSLVLGAGLVRRARRK